LRNFHENVNEKALQNSTKILNLGILGSTRGTDLKAIAEAAASGKLKANISVVISNIASAYILTRAANYSIPAVFVSHNKKKRRDFDAEISKALLNYNVELVLLVGFMRILSKEFCRDWRGRILNVHPSLLPKYAGGMDNNVHADVLKNGDIETGCTIHQVTETVDGGPIIIQKKCPVLKTDSPADLKARVQTLEGEAFIEAIKKITISWK